MNRWILACATAALIAGATTHTALAQERRQRTEAEARAAAERNRAERARQEAESGQPVALIHDYVLATVGPVPESLDVDPFYQKYVDAGGIPVLASTKVPDIALLVVRDIINTMLAARSDLRASMIERNWRTGVIAEVEMTMDIPEYSRMKRPGAPRDEPIMQADRDYHANRSRGLGGNPTTGAEENIRTSTGPRASSGGSSPNYGECFAGDVKVESPEEFEAYDPVLFELIGRMDIYHGKRIRPVACPAESGM